MNFLKASKMVFEEYLGKGYITTQRQLSDGEYIDHFELSRTIMVTSHLDSRIKMFTEEAMREYLEFVEGC